MKLHWRSFSELIQTCADSHGNKNALSIYREDHWYTLSYTALSEQSKVRAATLLKSGHRPGDRIALLANTSIEWVINFLAILRIGGIAVPLDPKATESELAKLLRHLEPRSLILEREFQSFGFTLQKELTLKKILFLEEEYADDSPHPDLPNIDHKSTALICYTSGTSGNPKGVMVSIESMLTELSLLQSYQETKTSSVVFSILPLHHLYGLVAGVLYSLVSGSEYVFAHRLSPGEIRFSLQERKATQLFVVPLLLQLMYRSIQEKLHSRSPREKFIFSALFSISRLLPYYLRRKLFSAIHTQIGGKLEAVVSGGAPLDSKTYSFFDRIGLPIYEGYGLSETGPVITVNTPKCNRKATVGKPLPGIEIKINLEAGELEGEIWTRGPHVMQGYFKNPELTQEVFTEDRWFKTGDLGRLDNGFLRIVGRKKSLIVLDSGKKIYAEEVEQALAGSDIFQENCVLGIPELDRGEQVVAVLYPSTKLLLLENEKQKKLIEAEVQRLTQELAPFKRPIRSIVLAEPMPKTANGKIKRNMLRETLIREKK